MKLEERSRDLAEENLKKEIANCLKLLEVRTLNIWELSDQIRSDQSLSRVRLCDPMNRSTPGLPVHHQLPEFTQTHVH